MAKRLTKYLGYLSIAGLVIIIDQVTKMVAFNNLQGMPAIDILPILQWVLVFNRGAAFGFLNEAGGAQHYFFSGLAIMASLIILVWLWRVFLQNRLLAWGLVLVLGGALGNLIDRLSHQYVIDFISLHYQDWYFPAFNVADMAITFGAICLIMDGFASGSGNGTKSGAE